MAKLALKYVLIVVLVMSFIVTAEAKQARITGLFSDMHFVQDAGDVVGMEVFIVYTAEGYYAVIQFAEGNPLVPVIVPVEVNKATLRFDVPLPTGKSGRFRGTVSDSSIVGKFENGGEAFELKRRKSYWQ